MRLLVKLLLGLALLSPVAEAWYYRVTGQFECHGQPASSIRGRTVKHDPNDDDITYFKIKDGILDFSDSDTDFAVYPSDPLELSIHVDFGCGGCHGEIYQYIDVLFQRANYKESQAVPMIMGTVELSDICRYGEAKSSYNRGDHDRLTREWLLRYDDVNILDHWDLID